MSGIVRNAHVSYIVNQITPPTTARSETRSVRCWRFPTLLDCYDFVVGILIGDLGHTVFAAERIALELPVEIDGCTLIVTREVGFPVRHLAPHDADDPAFHRSIAARPCDVTSRLDSRRQASPRRSRGPLPP